MSTLVRSTLPRWEIRDSLSWAAMLGAAVGSGVVGEEVEGAVVVGATVVGVGESVVRDMRSSATVDTIGCSAVTVVTSSLVSSPCSNVVTSTELAVVVLGSCFSSVVISSGCLSVVTDSSFGMSVVVVVVSDIVIVVVGTGSGSNGGAGAHETPAASSRLI